MIVRNDHEIQHLRGRPPHIHEAIPEALMEHIWKINEQERKGTTSDQAYTLLQRRKRVQMTFNLPCSKKKEENKDSLRL